jgi:serine protease Do
MPATIEEVILQRIVAPHNMRLSVDEIDMLDRYDKRTLTQEEAAGIEERMKGEASFREPAEQHLNLIREVRRRDERTRVRALLNAAHQELFMQTPAEAVVAQPVMTTDAGSRMEGAAALPEKETSTKQIRRFESRYWRLTGVAASVAVISIVATFLITQSLKKEQTANYKELRRNVEQIKRSQKLMMDDIADQKVVPTPPPANYAGTSFLISPNGYLTTSHHVVREADSIFVGNEEFGNLKAKVVYQDREHDIAILKISDFNLEKTILPYAISKKESSLAEDVFTLGYPKEDVVFGAGSISAITGYNGNPIAYQISVPVNPGNSGGPLFNNRGDLVGIISGQQTQSSGTAFAIKSTVLLESIELAPDSVKDLIRPSRISSQRIPSRVDQVNEWRKYVFMVRVYKEQ